MNKLYRFVWKYFITCVYTSFSFFHIYLFIYFFFCKFFFLLYPKRNYKMRESGRVKRKMLKNFAHPSGKIALAGIVIRYDTCRENFYLHCRCVLAYQKLYRETYMYIYIYIYVSA